MLKKFVTIKTLNLGGQTYLVLDYIMAKDFEQAEQFANKEYKERVVGEYSKEYERIV